MKIKKPIIIILVLISVFVLGGCSSKESGPRNLWDRYVEGMNEKNIEKVGATYNPKGSRAYNQYIASESNLSQFELVEKISTKKFEIDILSDVSTSTVIQKYCLAKVNATVTLQDTNFDLEFEVYMSMNSDDGWFFTSDVVVDPLADRQGNLPDASWLTNILFENDEYKYKATYTLTDTDVTYTSVSIANYNKNVKDVVIPEEINGLPVTTIKKYAFMKLGSIFEITYPSSKMRSLVIPNTVTTIEEYAFFESKKLKELTIPSSVTSIGEFAFASCTGLKKLVFDIDDSSLYSDEFMKEIASSSNNNIVIKGARNMYVGDIVNLSVENNQLVTWSIDKTSVASIDEDKGIITAKGVGDVTITAALKSDPTIKATVKVSVSSCQELTKIQGSAFDRCSGLKEIYIYAKNPNSVGVAGTTFKFTSGATIYVPKGSKEMYANSSNWSSYKDQIKEME